MGRLVDTQVKGMLMQRVVTCVSTINHSILKLRGRERRLISKASATGMSPLSPQGWVHGDFAFNLLSLTGIPGLAGNLPFNQHFINRR
ncbi:hypothetical protein CQ001_04980 [Erwinia billingiae]|nr:hypothetical protein CQ001_04980 [Erwinia billingiae]